MKHEITIKHQITLSNKDKKYKDFFDMEWKL